MPLMMTVTKIVKNLQSFKAWEITNIWRKISGEIIELEESVHFKLRYNEYS